MQSLYDVEIKLHESPQKLFMVQKTGITLRCETSVWNIFQCGRIFIKNASKVNSWFFTVLCL